MVAGTACPVQTSTVFLQRLDLQNLFCRRCWFHLRSSDSCLLNTSARHGTAPPGMSKAAWRSLRRRSQSARENLPDSSQLDKSVLADTPSRKRGSQAQIAWRSHKLALQASSHSSNVNCELCGRLLMSFARNMSWIKPSQCRACAHSGMRLQITAKFRMDPLIQSINTLSKHKQGADFFCCQSKCR